MYTAEIKGPKHISGKTIGLIIAAILALGVCISRIIIQENNTMESHIIEIDSTNKDKAIGLDIIAFQWAAGGACGEPGGVVFITRDSKVYHTNYVFDKYGITCDDLYEIFPPLAHMDVGVFGGGIYPDGWKDKYLGLGNYLVIHESIWEDFNQTAESELARLHGKGKNVILYNIWDSVILKVLKHE